MQPADVQLVKHLIQEAVDENEIIDLTSPPYDEKGQGGKGGAFDHPFKVSLSDGSIRIAKGRAHFWKRDSWLITELELSDPDSSAADEWTLETDSSSGSDDYIPEYIYVQLKYDPTWPEGTWELGHDTANPQNPIWNGTPADDQEQTTWVIAYIDETGSIDQRLNQDIYETSGS